MIEEIRIKQTTNVINIDIAAKIPNRCIGTTGIKYRDVKPTAVVKALNKRGIPVSLIVSFKRSSTLTVFFRTITF